MASYPSGLRDRFAKPLFAGSNPADASSFFILSCLGGGIGRHCRLKICCPYGRAGSSPAPGTDNKTPLFAGFYIRSKFIVIIYNIYVLSEATKNITLLHLNRHVSYFL